MATATVAKPYRLSPLAEADLENIWFYTFKHRSIEQADKYHQNIIAALEGLAAGARLGRPANILPDYQKYLCGSHVIYFLDYPNCLDVIRILHQRQDVERNLPELTS